MSASHYANVLVSYTPSDTSAICSGPQDEGDKQPFTSPHCDHFGSAEDPSFGVPPLYQGDLILSQATTTSAEYEEASLPDRTVDLLGYQQQEAESMGPTLTDEDFFKYLCDGLDLSLFMDYGTVDSYDAPTHLGDVISVSNPPSLGSASGSNTHSSGSGANHGRLTLLVEAPMPIAAHIYARPQSGTVSQAVAGPSNHSRASPALTGLVEPTSWSSPSSALESTPAGVSALGGNKNARLILCTLEDSQRATCGYSYWYSRDADVSQHLVIYHGIAEDQLSSGDDTLCPGFGCTCKSRYCKFEPSTSSSSPYRRTRHHAHTRNLTRHVIDRHHGILFPCPFEGCTKQFSQKQSVTRHVKADHS